MAKHQRASGLSVGMKPRERSGVLMLLLALVVGIGAFNLPQGEASLLQVWVAFSIYMLVLALPFILYRPSWGWLHPLIFWVLWAELVRHVLPRLGVYADGLQAHQVMPGAGGSELNAVVVQALLLTAIGLMAMYTGFTVAGRLSAPRLTFRAPRHLVIKTGLITVVALGALFVLIDKAGGLGPLMLQRGLSGDTRIFVDPTARAGKYLVGILKPACIVWFSLRPKAWRNPIWLGFFGLALTIGFMATGSRSGVAMPVLIAGVIWMLHYRRVPYTAIVVAALFSMTVLGVGGAFREASRGADSLSNIDLSTNIVDGVANGFLGMVTYGTTSDGTYGILASVPRQEPFIWGESYLSILFAPIPSAILPFEKPRAGGKLNAMRVFDNPQSAVPTGSIGEAYWNFGTPGVILIMCLFGAVVKWFYRLYVVNRGSGWVISVYVITLFMLRPTSEAFYSWLHAVIPVTIFLWLYCGMPRRDRNFPASHPGGAGDSLIFNAS